VPTRCCIIFRSAHPSLCLHRIQRNTIRIFTIYRPHWLLPENATAIHTSPDTKDESQHSVHISNALNFERFNTHVIITIYHEATSSDAIHGYPFCGGLGSSLSPQSLRTISKIDPIAKPRTRTSVAAVQAGGLRRTVRDASANARASLPSKMSATNA
jgi:hypothetical protein